MPALIWGNSRKEWETHLQACTKFLKCWEKKSFVVGLWLETKPNFKPAYLHHIAPPKTARLSPFCLVNTPVFTIYNPKGPDLGDNQLGPSIRDSACKCSVRSSSSWLIRAVFSSWQWKENQTDLQLNIWICSATVGFILSGAYFFWTSLVRGI